METGVIQATAAAQGDLETFLHKSAHHILVPIGQVEANLCWKLLHHCLQFGLLHSVDRGGNHPTARRPSPPGPPSPKTATHRPMVWASRPSASATATAVQPWTKSHGACHRSRSRGVGAQYIRRRRSPASSCHRSRNPCISPIPNTNTTLLSFQAIRSSPQFYLIPM